MGFKVYELPSNFLAYPGFQIILRDSQKGDAFLTLKQLYRDFDIVVGNSINSIEFTLASPRVIKEFI